MFRRSENSSHIFFMIFLVLLGFTHSFFSMDSEKMTETSHPFKPILPLLSSCNTKQLKEYVKHNKPDINAVTSDGWSLLHYASFYSQPTKSSHPIISYLLHKKVAVNLQTNTGSTPLHIAVQTGDLQAVETLVKNGAVVIQADLDGRVPLHLAAEKGFTDIVTYLLKNGAESSLDCANRWGLTPRQIIEGKLMADGVKSPIHK